MWFAAWRSSSLILSASCAEPPSKEMNQAQGAIDAARAAGAESFAAAEFTAAVDALKRSERSRRRRRLSPGAEPRARQPRARAERRQAGRRGRANARGEAERAVAEVATLLATAEAPIEGLADVRARSLNGAATAPSHIAAAEKMLQEARAALETEDYPAVATRRSNGAAAELQAALTQIDAAGVAAHRPAASARAPARAIAVFAIDDSCIE